MRGDKYNLVTAYTRSHYGSSVCIYTQSLRQLDCIYTQSLWQFGLHIHAVIMAVGTAYTRSHYGCLDCIYTQSLRLLGLHIHAVITAVGSGRSIENFYYIAGAM